MFRASHLSWPQSHYFIMRISHLKSFRSAIVSAVLLTCVAPPSFAQVEGEHIGVSSAHPVAAIQDTETPAQRNERMAWWREARFGMFIHWGLYSIPAGTWDGKQIPSIGEWIMNNASIPVKDYKALASQFNPTSFNAHDIVALAKSAGMKYIVITAKHRCPIHGEPLAYLTKALDLRRRDDALRVGTNVE